MCLQCSQEKPDVVLLDVHLSQQSVDILDGLRSSQDTIGVRCHVVAQV